MVRVTLNDSVEALEEGQKDISVIFITVTSLTFWFCFWNCSLLSTRSCNHLQFLPFPQKDRAECSQRRGLCSCWNRWYCFLSAWWRLLHDWHFCILPWTWLKVKLKCCSSAFFTCWCIFIISLTNMETTTSSMELNTVQIQHVSSHFIITKYKMLYIENYLL